MNRIKIETIIKADIDKVWEMFTNPEHVIKWNHASDDWHSPRADNDLRAGGKFNFRMEAKDGSEGFDFTGMYTKVEPQQQLAYTIEDGRIVVVDFEKLEGGSVRVAEEFEMEGQNSEELQRSGWQAILDNFKKYVEAN